MNILVFFVLLVFCPEILAEKNFRTPEVIQFANDLSEKSQYQRSEILNVLNSANHRQIVIDNISKPAEIKITEVPKSGCDPINITGIEIIIIAQKIYLAFGGRCRSCK